jgi:hypothetical protein
MGPGILIKSLLQGGFSLMVFGWAQIIMDIQPLIVMISGEGHLHGFSHTYIGASLLGLFSALTGKYLSEIGLFLLGLNAQWQVNISGWVSLLSALVGTFSHVFIDSIMHSDIEPFFPWDHSNQYLGLISVQALHKACLYSGLVGGVLYFSTHGVREFLAKNRKSKQ